MSNYALTSLIIAYAIKHCWSVYATVLLFACYHFD